MRLVASFLITLVVFAVIAAGVIYPAIGALVIFAIIFCGFWIMTHVTFMDFDWH